MKGVAIPYVIALVLGVIIIGLIGYWLIFQGGKTIIVGNKAECDTMAFNYCNGFTSNFDETKCPGLKPEKDSTGKCIETPSYTTPSGSQQCTNGQTRNCVISPTESGIQQCVNGVWGGCER